MSKTHPSDTSGSGINIMYLYVDDPMYKSESTETFRNLNFCYLGSQNLSASWNYKLKGY